MSHLEGIDCVSYSSFVLHLPLPFLVLVYLPGFVISIKEKDFYALLELFREFSRVKELLYCHHRRRNPNDRYQQ
jgi:hypothetical protein